MLVLTIDISHGPVRMYVIYVYLEGIMPIYYLRMTYELLWLVSIFDEL